MFSPRPYRHRLAAALLIGLLAFQAVGWLVAWHTARWEAHFSAQQVLNEESTPLTSLALHTSALPALRIGKKEIWYAGRLYDIRSAHLMGDSVRLELYHDQHEERLYGLLGKVFCSGGDASSSPVSPVQVWLAKWLGAAFVMPEILAFRVWTELGKSPLLVFCRALVAQQEPGIFGPPPEGTPELRSGRV